MSKQQKYFNNPNQEKQTIKQQITATSLYSGPVPDPDSLRRYNEIDPTFASTLIKMAQIEQENRLQLSQKTADTDAYVRKWEVRSIILGQLLAISTVVIATGLCIFAFTLGQFAIGAGIVGTLLAGIAVAFIADRRKQK